jgi:hypothetical protein
MNELSQRNGCFSYTQQLYPAGRRRDCVLPDSLLIPVGALVDGIVEVAGLVIIAALLWFFLTRPTQRKNTVALEGKTVSTESACCAMLIPV